MPLVPAKLRTVSARSPWALVEVFCFLLPLKMSLFLPLQLWGGPFSIPRSPWLLSPLPESPRARGPPAIKRPGYVGW